MEVSRDQAHLLADLGDRKTIRAGVGRRVGAGERIDGGSLGVDLDREGLIELWVTVRQWLIERVGADRSYRRVACAGTEGSLIEDRDTARVANRAQGASRLYGNLESLGSWVPVDVTTERLTLDWNLFQIETSVAVIIDKWLSH
jgi:hypothetical protein